MNQNLEEIIEFNRKSTSFNLINILFQIQFAQILAMFIFKSYTEQSIIVESSILPVSISFLFLTFNLFHYHSSVLIMIEDKWWGELFSVFIMVLNMVAIYISFQFPEQWLIAVSVIILFVAVKNGQLFLVLAKGHRLKNEFIKWSIWALVYSVATLIFHFLVYSKYYKIDDTNNGHRFTWFVVVVVTIVCLLNWKKLNKEELKTLNEDISNSLKNQNAKNNT